MPAPHVGISFTQSPDFRQQTEEVRQAREVRMRNALEILASQFGERDFSYSGFRRFVRATAREGLGRDGGS